MSAYLRFVQLKNFVDNQVNFSMKGIWLVDKRNNTDLDRESLYIVGVVLHFFFM
jgi:hypothetical protein